MTSLSSLLLQLPMPMLLVDCVAVAVVWIQLGRSRSALASFAWFTSLALACSTSLPLLSRRARLSCHIISCCTRRPNCSRRLLLVFLFNISSGEEIRWALPPQRGEPRHCFSEGDHSCSRAMPLLTHAQTAGCMPACNIHAVIYIRLTY